MGLRRFHAENHQNSNQNTAQNTARHPGFCYSLPKSNVFAVLTDPSGPSKLQTPSWEAPGRRAVGGHPHEKKDQPSRPSFFPPRPAHKTSSVLLPWAFARITCDCLLFGLQTKKQTICLLLHWPRIVLDSRPRIRFAERVISFQ